jgi:hypothetical protein
MGLTYRFKLTAPNTFSSDQLKAALLRIESEAQDIGFEPTTVLDAVFDTPERQQFCRRLTHGLEFRSNSRIHAKLEPNQVWDFDAEDGSCRIIPTHGVFLVVTDEREQEGIFGFLKYPPSLKMADDSAVLTGAPQNWFFEDSLKTPDQKYRELIRLFMEEGFVEEEEDDYAKGGKTFIYLPQSFEAAHNLINNALKEPLEKVCRREFLMAYCSVAYLYGGFHPDDWQLWDGPAEVKLFAAEAWRRFKANEITDNELYPYQVTKAPIIHSWRK